jgi:lipoate---protein ligase
MQLIDYSAKTCRENLALDEALVESADTWNGDGNAPTETLRVWEMPAVCVVMGRGSKPTEIREAACVLDQTPVLRRHSGGASIVAGPGCLLYSVLLSLEKRPGLRDIDFAHRFVMEKILIGVSTIVPEVKLLGTCDLTQNGKKCSGNALRFKRNWVLYHGTLLYDFPLELISRYLAMPPRMPDYRSNRHHDAFVANLGCDVSRLKQALCQAWNATGNWEDHPFQTQIIAEAQKLLESKYQ